ncbi:hypothetical protein VNO77_19292 [Canavalia gladiata]|uniref:Uncharacterized protein n=1 Tax=Canavalia gladiata TaxID=3824 RepID=A0AAN9LR30_CANGL
MTKRVSVKTDRLEKSQKTASILIRLFQNCTGRIGLCMENSPMYELCLYGYAVLWFYNQASHQNNIRLESNDSSQVPFPLWLLAYEIHALGT